MPKSQNRFAVERRRTMRNTRPPTVTQARPAASYRGAIRNAFGHSSGGRKLTASKQVEKTDTIAPEE